MMMARNSRRNEKEDSVRKDKFDDGEAVVIRIGAARESDQQGDRVSRCGANHTWLKCSEAFHAPCSVEVVCKLSGSE
jgi:hypothetical protein